jgi:site-specific DNA-methyltransferase (adenine-specific)
VLAVLNLPLWCAHHARFLHRELGFLNWVAWESMSLPARAIMPSHYALLLFRKPGGSGQSGRVEESRSGRTGLELPLFHSSTLPLFHSPPDLLALNHGYCLRPGCVRRRDAAAAHVPVTDLWCDIHRVKHNSRRWDHPCQLPPKFLRRLVAATTAPGDLVLDAFNGIGTTTLVAQAMGRRFLGIELSEEYFTVARARHELLAAGGDPFAPRDGTPSVKNNSVRRQPRVAYAVPKKTIQLAVRQLAAEIGRMPTPEDALRHLPYPEETYRACFKSWSEVLAAARTTGMSERRTG